MSKIRHAVRACDICGSENDVVRIRLYIGDERRAGDVCARHRKGADTLFAKLPNPARGIAAIPVLGEEEWRREQERARKPNRRTSEAGKSDRSGAPGVTGRGASLSSDTETSEGGAR